jgi:ABC-2 type transport system ATP-binding protein
MGYGSRRLQSMRAIEVERLTRHFRYYQKQEGLSGSLKNLLRRKALVREAVRGVSFSIGDGEIVGFLGPNGAGKTTTLKMLSGISTPPPEPPMSWDKCPGSGRRTSA